MRLRLRLRKTSAAVLRSKKVLQCRGQTGKSEEGGVNGGEKELGVKGGR